MMAETKDWQELTRLTQGAPLVVERVRLADQDVVLEGRFALPQLARLSGEDQIFVAAFLRYDLSGRKVIVNREVELVRPGLEGSRTDIQIEAHPASGPRDPNPLTVVIESKGCWNNDLDTGLRQQLVAKYLEKPGKRAGIYLIAYFDDPVWKRDKRESRKHAGYTIDAILQRQLALAAEAVNASPGLAVTAMVLDCRLPGDRAKEQSNQ